MSQVLEQPERRHHRRKGWWLFAALALLLVVAGGVRLAGNDGGSSEVLGAGAGKSTPTTGPTEVLGASESRPGLEAPAITSGPGEGSTGNSSTARFTYSHPVNGANFSCSLDNAAFARCPRDGITYRNLAAGPHFFAVAAQQGNGPLSAPASRNWTVGVPPVPAPAAPVITVGPPASTIEPDATFIFTHERTDVSFQCRLDSGPFEGCSSPNEYEDLTVGSHTFFVRAVAGTVAGPTAQRSWTVVQAGFGISGSLAADQLLAPGVSWPLDLVFTNPYNNAQGINVKTLDITVNDLTMRDGKPNPDCIGSQNVSVDPQSAWRINLPARSTVRLSDRVSNQGLWPQVTMKNEPWNQDGCKNSTFTFTYSGTAEK
jgi:hypothetical protein